MTRPSPLSHVRRWCGGVLLGAGLLAATLVPALAGTPVSKVKSPGGLEAWLIESHEVGLISMQVGFEGGALAEPKDKYGVARMVAWMFNEGADDMDTDTFSSVRQRIGVNISASADSTGVTLSFSAPSAYRAEAFALLRKSLHRPRYDVGAFERGQRYHEASLTAELQAPGSIAGNHLSKALFRDSRFAVPISDTLDSLKRLTPADAKVFRERAFARSNLKIAVAGDITSTELAPLIDDLFGSLPATTDVPAHPALTAQTASDIVIPMAIPQTVVMLGNVAPRLDWRQSLAFDIGSQILSGGSTGRLFREVREKRGLVYAIQSQRYDLASTSVFFATFGAGADNVQSALDETRREIGRFLAEGPSDEEVETAKGAFLGSFFLGLDTNDKLVAQVLWMLRNDLPITYLDDYAAELAKISTADIMAATRLAVRPEVFNTAVVGNTPADFRLANRTVVNAAQ